MSTLRQWFNFKASADGQSVDIQILDFIGSWDDDWFARNFGYEMGVTARQFVEDLGALPETVKVAKVHINSPGGDVQGGINIANALRSWAASKGRTVETYVDGIAASIASVIAMAGSRVVMADNALMMVHEPWGGAIGNSAEMRKVADILDTMRGQIVATYKWHTPMEEDAIVALLDAETWMDADEALANGFATEKVAGLAASATIDRRASASLTIPEKFRARVQAFLKPDPTPAPAPVAAAALAVVKACNAAGFPQLVETLIAAGATLEQVTAKVTEATDARARETFRAEAITAACTLAKVPDLAAEYIAGGMTIEAVKAQLTKVRAALDKAEIDTNLPPGGGSGAAKPVIDTDAIYRDINKPSAGRTH